MASEDQLMGGTAAAVATVCCVWLCLLMSSLCLAQVKKADTAPGPASEKLLASRSYPSGGKQRKLTLRQIFLPPPPSVDINTLMRELQEKKDTTLPTDFESFNQTSGSAIFAVVDSPAESDGAGNLLGIVYAHHGLGPLQTQWSGDIVIDKSGGDPYVILARSLFPDLTLAVYRVSPAKKVADFPYAFDRKDWDKWPKPPAQFSEWKTEAYAECGFDKLEAEQDGRTLVVRLAREGAQCSPTTFRFDTETKTWSGPQK